MSDYKLPDLPSDDELGITDADREEYEKHFGDEGGELSEKELAALLGESPTPKKGAPAGSDAGGSEKAKASKKKSSKPTRAERRAEKQRTKEEKQKQKEQKKAAAEAKKAKGESKKAKAPVDSTAQPDAAGAADAGSTGDGPSGSGPGSPKRAAPPAEAPRSRWRGPATLALLLAVSFVASSRTGLPRPVPANAADTAFSSARAMATLVEIAREAHPPGSPEHSRVREFLMDRLRTLGLDPEVQTTTSVIQTAAFARSATVRNIVARIPGTASTGTVLITAHYDSREIAIGAGDDGSGVVSIIEAVRALQADEPLQNDVIVLLTDAEELGLLGARAFVDQHPWMNEVTIALSLEMRGGGGPSIMFETKRDNGWIVRALDDFDAHPFANSLSLEIYERMPNDTDFTPFKEAGVQGLNFAAIDNAHVYHQLYDSPENVSESTLQHHGYHALGALKYLGNADLSSVDGPDVVYFSVPVLGLIVYSQNWSIPISAVAVLLFAVSLLVGRRAGARLGGAAAGLGVAVGCAALAFGAAWGLQWWLPRFHGELDSLHGSAYHSEGWYVLAVAFATLFIVVTATTLARRWLSVVELCVGALVIPLVAAVWLSVAVPLGAMNLQWPVMAALLATIVVALLRDRAEGLVGWIATVVLAVPVLVMLIWVTELLWLAMSIRFAGPLAVLFAITFLLCLPALTGLNHPNRWWAPASTVALAAAAVGLGLLGSRPSADRQVPTTLVYAYEHGTGAALWATSASDEAAGRTWAVERAAGAFTDSLDLTGFGYRPGLTPVTSAPVISAAPPSVVVVSDTIAEGERRVTLRVRSRIGAEMLRFEYDDPGNTRLISINGTGIQDPAGLVWADHWGEPDGDVVLELTMPPTEPIGLQIIEHLLRPAELLGPTPFERPEDFAPDITWMSDRAMFRYSVAAFADPRHAILLPGGASPEPSPGMPLDTLPVAIDTGAVDTLTTAPTVGDTIAADTTAMDTLAADSLAGDTLVVDTIPGG